MAGQTLSEIRRLFDERRLTPRHRLGQNFLVDLNLMRKLVRAAEVQAADVVLEVGAGTGSLTEILLETGARVVAVEVDPALSDMLRERFADPEQTSGLSRAARARLTLLTCDALAGKHQVNPALLDAVLREQPQADGARKLVANLPYQIATPLLMELLCGEPRFERLACTIQKEVAARFLAPVGSADYGPVSVVAQSLARIRRIAALPPAAFWPRPKVESTMLLIQPGTSPRPVCGTGVPPVEAWAEACRRKSRRHGTRPEAGPPTEIVDLDAFLSLVRRAFLHRRQMMRKIVGRWEEGTNVLSALAACRIDPTARPQEIAPEAWRRLHRALVERPFR